jgi:DNA invertase Pin-like site-specific DNA recombinase
MEYGYCRISRKTMNIERQIRNILSVYPKAKIIKEVFTRTSFVGRKEWNKLLNTIKSGDTIIFDSVSRMCGNADEGCRIYEELFLKGVTLVFLKEEHINTEVYKKALESHISTVVNTGDSATDNLLNSIITALNDYTIQLAKRQIRIVFEQAEKEVTDLHQRTKEGLETARLSGKQIGIAKGTTLTTKKSVKAKEIILKHSADFNGTLNDNEVITLCGISRNSFYKYKKEIKEDLEKED